MNVRISKLINFLCSSLFFKRLEFSRLIIFRYNYQLIPSICSFYFYIELFLITKRSIVVSRPGITRFISHRLEREKKAGIIVIPMVIFQSV